MRRGALIIDNDYTYQIVNPYIKRLEDETFIPKDLNNADYAEFLKWCEDGNEPLPEPILEPPAPPTPEEKLAASGLTVEELKALLGL